MTIIWKERLRKWERRHCPWRKGQLNNSNVKFDKYDHYEKEGYLDKCYSCGQVGHFTKKCKSKNRREETTNFLIKDVEEEEAFYDYKKLGCWANAIEQFGKTSN